MSFKLLLSMLREGGALKNFGSYSLGEERPWKIAGGQCHHLIRSLAALWGTDYEASV